MKLGKLKISDILIREDPMSLLPVFAKFVPIYIEIRPHYRDYVYTGLCDEFDDIKKGDAIPVYSCTMSMEGDKVIAGKFEKINP